MISVQRLPKLSTNNSTIGEGNLNKLSTNNSNLKESLGILAGIFFINSEAPVTNLANVYQSLPIAMNVTQKNRSMGKSVC